MRICTVGFEDGGHTLLGDVYTGNSSNTVWNAPWGTARCVQVIPTGVSASSLTYLRDMTPNGTGDFTHVFVRIWTRRGEVTYPNYLRLSLRDENNVDIIRIGGTGVFNVLGVEQDLGSAYDPFGYPHWKCVEFEVNMDIGGGVTVRYNGVEVYTKTVDMTTLGGSEVRYAGIYISASYSHTGNYDDIAVNDTQGAAHNSWPPQARIAGLVPNGDGVYSGWSPHPGTGEDNYEDVDEIPEDGDTTFVAAGEGALRDTYTREAIASFLGLVPHHIHIVTPITIAKLSSAGAAQYRPIATKGVTTQVGTTHSPSNSKYGRFGWCMDDAPDGSAWDDAVFDATIFGMDSL